MADLSLCHSVSSVRVCPIQCLSMLQVSALHYLTRSQESEGFQRVASAHVLHQPTIVGPSISIINVHKFGI